MAPVNKNLGNRLRELRGEQSLYAVEKETSVPRGNLLRYEQGHHLPTESVLKKLANHYGVSYRELRMLYYSDWFERHPEEKEIVISWVQAL